MGPMPFASQPLCLPCAPGVQLAPPTKAHAYLYFQSPRIRPSQPCVDATSPGASDGTVMLLCPNLTLVVLSIQLKHDASVFVALSTC
ncbi:hypothetical protein EVG20_g2027 [Dentipellis fragilis]|uniref:Uncharacterized protein n=1 Tax=Dentipellis fragilis TaxID=205917 RepID=A0A4Y9ZC55_9AGAM|nr:hypothetical protein EVG20_g2027 [Dentipellis fragilis]